MYKYLVVSEKANNRLVEEVPVHGDVNAADAELRRKYPANRYSISLVTSSHPTDTPHADTRSMFTGFR